MFIIYLMVAIAAIAIPMIVRKGLGVTLSSSVVAILSVATVGIGLLSYPVAHHVAQRGAIGGFHQFLNGSIVDTDMKRIRCERDGDCVRTYDCDHYTVTVVDKAAYWDKDGNYHPEESHKETKHHECPYATEEFTFTAEDSIDVPGHDRTHTIAEHIFAEHPQRWRSSKNIPNDIARGVPEVWQTMTYAVDHGLLFNITANDVDYDNFILADEDTILREYSDDIDQLLELKLLPEHTQNLRDPIYDGFNANKMQFVGFTPANAADWQLELMNLNAALGMDFQGDLHVVAIKASVLDDVVSPDEYLLALKAHWQNNFGKDAIPKNAIILVMGVDDSGSSVLWSRAQTGMPKGNEDMLQGLTNISEKPFNIETLLGSTTARVVFDDGEPEPEYTIGSGAIPQIIMVEFPFKRACMACKDKGEAEADGYTYISTDIPVGTGLKIATIVIDYLLFAAMWFVAISLSPTVGGPGFTPYRPQLVRRRYDDSYGSLVSRKRDKLFL